MVDNVTFGGVLKTAIVTGFSIAVALIWRDFLITFLNVILPPGNEVLYSFIVAIVSTVLLITAIFVVLKTEAEAEIVIGRIKKNQLKNGKSKNSKTL
ncbi:MAG: DUF5654 family protein [Candidatus Woesearchaeota archaeon]